MSPPGSGSARSRIREGASRSRVAAVQASSAVGGLRVKPSDQAGGKGGAETASGWLASLRMAAHIVGKISVRTRHLLSHGQALNDVLRAIAKGCDRRTGKASYWVKGPTQKGLPSQKPGRWQQGLYRQGKGSTTGTGARKALGRRACTKGREAGGPSHCMPRPATPNQAGPASRNRPIGCVTISRLVVQRGSTRSGGARSLADAGHRPPRDCHLAAAAPARRLGPARGALQSSRRWTARTPITSVTCPSRPDRRKQAGAPRRANQRSAVAGDRRPTVAGAS